MRSLQSGIARPRSLRFRLGRFKAARLGGLGPLLLAYLVGCGAAPGVEASSSTRPARTRVVAVSYRAPFGCPSPEQFVSSIENRSALLEPELGPNVTGPGDHVRAQIRADPAGPGWLGSILIEGSSPLERAVRGEHCEDVASALALIAVLRLEPERAPAASTFDATNPASSNDPSSTGTSAENTAPSAAGPPSAATSGGPGDAASASTASSAPLPTTVPVPSSGIPAADSTAAAPVTSPSAPSAAPPPSDSAPPNLPPSDWEPAPAKDGSAAPSAPSAPSAPGSDRVSDPEASSPTAPQPDRSSESSPSEAQTEPSVAAAVPEPHTNVGSALDGSPPPLLFSLTAAAGYAAAPAPSFEVALGAELRFGDRIESWVAAASLLYRQGSRSSASGDLSLRLIGAELSACPLAFRMGAHAWARMCAELDAGLLAASVSQRELPIEGDDTFRPWLSLGPSLQLGIPLGTRLSLRLLAQAEAVLIRDHFDVARLDSSADVILYRSPALSGSLLLGIGYMF
jgi:hypothetical protein